jgi:hypothetical protein
MNRVVVGLVGLTTAAAVLVGCSDNKSGPAPATAAGGAQVSTGGSTEVKVDGKDLSGVDLSSVTCVKQSGKINVASGAINGQAGLAVVMTERSRRPSTRWACRLMASALAVTNTMGAKVGSADGQGRRQHLHHHR